MAQGYGQMNEAEHAFEIYLSLGAKRDLYEVAELTGKSVRTIQQYKKIFGWNERIQDYIARFGEVVNVNADVQEEPDGEGIGGIEKVFEDGKPVAREKTITNQEKYDLLSAGKFKQPEIYMEDKDMTPQQMINRWGEGLGAMTKGEYRLLLGSLIRDFARRFRDGEVKINTIYEFERVVKLDLLLMGETVPVPGQITINNNTIGGAEYNIKVEQVLKNNPQAQNLLAEMWRSYQNPTQIFQERMDNYDDGMSSLKELVNDTTPPMKGLENNDGASFQTEPGEGSSRVVRANHSPAPSSPGEEISSDKYDGYNTDMAIIDDPLEADNKM